MRHLGCALVVLGIALAPPALSAQETGAVVGLVRDSRGQPLTDVLVYVGDGTAATLTDELGLYGLFALPRGPYVVSYRKAGYAPRSFDLDLSSGEDYRDLGAVVLEPGAEPTATFQGRVTDGQGGPGLAGATIEINGRVVAETDSTGAFSIPGSPVVWGANELVVRHRAFSDRSMTDRVWVANADETFDFVVAMGVDPVTLPGIDVEVRSRVLAAAGFYEREEEHRSAVFITREQIEERNPARMEDLFRGTLGSGMSRSMRQTSGGADASTGFPTAARSFGNAEDGRPCAPLFYLDGLLMGNLLGPDGGGSNAPGQDGLRGDDPLAARGGIGSQLDQLLDPDQVEGVEVYESISDLPARFSPVGAVCGVVVIWTRQGN
jgi:hypothetical protein